MTAEYDRKQAADGIRKAIAQLNKAVADAAEVGVRIEDFNPIDATRCIDRCPCVIYNPTIIWKEEL